MADKGLDALLVTDPASRYYVSGWGMFDSNPGETAYWVLADHDSSIVLTGQSDVVEAREEAAHSRIIGLPGMEKRQIARYTANLIKRAGYKRVGYDDFHLGTNRYHQLREALPAEIELVPVADLVREVRAVKEPGELELMREAIRITDESYAALTEWIGPGKTEKEAAWFLEKYMKDHGSQGMAFRIIMACGPGGTVPHHEPTERPFREGEPCWVDYGAKVGFYGADLTRSFCLGYADDQTQEVYDAVIASLDAGIAALRVGTRGDVAARAAAAEIEKRGLPVGHVLGHGTGLQVHELPSVHPGASVILRENMIITAEPGVYFPGWGGIRVEDDVLVTPSGPEILTKASRQLVI